MYPCCTACIRRCILYGYNARRDVSICCHMGMDMDTWMYASEECCMDKYTYIYIYIYIYIYAVFVQMDVWIDQVST